MASPIDELKSELTQCAICLGDLRDPRCLPCLHSFCERCLQSSLHVFQQSINPQRMAFQCPSCRKKTRIPPEGVEGFPRDFKANKIADFLENSSVNQDRPKCQVCRSFDVEDVKIFCCDCRKHFCSACEKKFHNFSIFEDHVTIQMGVLKRNQEQKCATHTNETLSFYCETCDSSICMSCLCTKHSTHEVREIDQEQLFSRHRYSDHLYELQNLSLDLQKKLQTISFHLRLVKANHIHVTDQIKAHSDKLKDIIAENERSLLSEADSYFMNTLRKLMDDRDQTESLLSNSNKLLSNVYSTVIYGNRQNIEDEEKNLEKQMKGIRITNEKNCDIGVDHKSEFIEFQPIDNLKVGSVLKRINENQIKINEVMQEINDVKDGEDMGMYDTLPDIIEDTPASTVSQINKEEVKCVNKDRNYDLHEQSSNKTLSNESFINALHQERYPYVANLTHHFLPQRQRKSSAICQKTAFKYAQSCFMNNSILPKDYHSHSYKKNTKNMKQLMKFSSQTRTHSQHQIQARLVKVLDQKGKGQGHLLNPSSVCFNKDGDIVVGELGNRRLQLFDLHGNFKKIIGQGQITPKCVVAMESNQYVIVDEVTKSIKILDDSDNSITTMMCKISFPHTIGFSNEETFIVADVVFDSISKITIDGQMKSEYKNHGNSLNDLDNPSSLHICENSTVFVTDTGNHQIKFLDENLNLMYKFGSYGNQNGQFRYPRGITGNKDFLFISDSGNDRIVVYNHSGKYLGCLLDKHSGIRNPSGLCFHDDTNTLCIVLSDCDEVMIYEIKT